MRMIRDENDVGIIQRIVLAVFVQYLADRAVGHVLEVSNLGIEWILRSVGEYVDSGKVDHLQVRYAMFLDHFVHLHDRGTIQGSAQRAFRVSALHCSADQMRKKVRKRIWADGAEIGRPTMHRQHRYVGPYPKLLI